MGDQGARRYGYLPEAGTQPGPAEGPVAAPSATTGRSRGSQPGPTLPKRTEGKLLYRCDGYTRAKIGDHLSAGIHPYSQKWTGTKPATLTSEQNGLRGKVKLAVVPLLDWRG